MTPLKSLPNELWWNIVSALGIEDVISLSRTCKQLYLYVHSNHVSKAVTKVSSASSQLVLSYVWPCQVLILREKEKIPFSKESIAASQADYSRSSALRKWTKRTEGLATANPYSIAILGVGLTCLYHQGALWYMIDDTIRLLEIRHSPTEELVIHVPNLLRATGLISQPKVAGSFSLLHCHEGVLSCLYRFSSSSQGGWLIVVDVKKRSILLSQEINSTEKLFARHDADYLYYGIYKANEYDGRRRWVLHGYDLKTKKFLGKNNFLDDLIGSELGSTICFEIRDGFFYAASNQTTYEVEEIDWTSFYHCKRFPLNRPSRDMLETTDNTSMWRRQHLEGPLDDRWTSLDLVTDEASGELIIVECRKEWLQGRSTGQRTVYKTKVVFPERQSDECNHLRLSNTTSIMSLASLNPPISSNQSFVSSIGTASSSTAIQSNYVSSMEMPIISEEDYRRLALVTRTQDRLALTVTAANDPHFLPPEVRLPGNVHSEPINPHQRSFVLSKTPAKYYNLSANSFVDLVNHQQEHTSVSQCLRIRVCSRRLKPPVRDKDDIVLPMGRNPLTGELMEGLNEEYEDGPVTFWPPALPAYGHENQASKDLHALMNPPAFIGNVHGEFDETSLVYMTGAEGEPKAIVFVNFDPAIKLQGLKKWHNTQDETGLHTKIYGMDCVDEEQTAQAHTSNSKTAKHPNTVSAGALEGEEGPHLKRRKANTPNTKTRAQSTCATSYPEHDSTSENGWLRSEPAMYLSIARGYDFGL